MTDLQQRLRTMLGWFHNYCVKEGITYYGVGGTVIGAVRHDGFIPWDDDIDLALPREDYNKLLKKLTKPIDGYFLESPYSGANDYLYTYAKLYDQSTTFVEKMKYPCRRGIYIDVFPLDNLGNTKEQAINNFRRFDRRNMFLMTRTCVKRKDRAWYKNLSISLASCIPAFAVDNKKLSMKLDKMAAEIHNDNTGAVYVANMMGTYRDKEITKSEYFGNPVLHKFEDIDIFIPEKYDEYLTDIYGDWRKLPPPEKRKTQHDYIELNLNKAYMS